jgi:hypothetical protein
VGGECGARHEARRSVWLGWGRKVSASVPQSRGAHESGGTAVSGRYVGDDAAPQARAQSQVGCGIGSGALATAAPCAVM